MQVTARLEESSVRDILAGLLPLTILLDDDGDRWIRIDPARTVDFAPDEGLRIEVEGQIRWRTAGVPLLLTINSAQLLLMPSIVEDEQGGRLVFRPSLEKMDLKHLPDFIDTGIANIVNKRLAGEGDQLSWHYAESLKSRFPVGKDLVEAEAFELSARGGTVQVLADAVIFTLDLAMRFTRRAT